MFKLIALNYTVMLNSQWLNIKGKNNFLETLVSVMLAFNQKKYVIKEI